MSSETTNSCFVVDGIWKPTLLGLPHPTVDVYEVSPQSNTQLQQGIRVSRELIKNFYKKYLKRYRVFRTVAVIYNLIRNRIKRVYTRRLHEKSDAREMIKISKFLGGKKLKVLAPHRAVNVPFPKAIPPEKAHFLKCPGEKFCFPEVSLVRLNNMKIFGGTNFIFSKNRVLFHDLYDFKTDYTPEEMHSLGFIDRSGTMKWYLENSDFEEISAAATFVDACAVNYAHWLTETLPRIALFCQQKAYFDIPLVVNSGLHPNIMESLAVVANKRKIITLPSRKALLVENLYWVSAVGYVPFEPRNKNYTGYNHGVFSPDAFKAIKDSLGQYNEIFNFPSPEKVFLRRKGNYRNLLNSREIEEFLLNRGFTIVEPESLTFLQQVILFRNAKIIIGPIGAAFANIIFCSPEAKIYIITTGNKDMLYWYWQNIACASGASVNYLLGEAYGDSVHSDYVIELENLKAALS